MPTYIQDSRHIWVNVGLDYSIINKLYVPRNINVLRPTYFAIIPLDAKGHILQDKLYFFHRTQSVALSRCTQQTNHYNNKYYQYIVRYLLADNTAYTKAYLTLPQLSHKTYTQRSKVYFYYKTRHTTVGIIIYTRQVFTIYFVQKYLGTPHVWERFF